MKILLWFRCLRHWNWYNWLYNNDEKFVLYNDLSHVYYNVGDELTITSVNRTTGVVTFKKM